MKKQDQPIEIVNNKTKLIAFAGNAQGGKGTSVSYITGMVWHLNNLINKFDVNPAGQLRIYDLKNHKFPEGKVFDTFTWNNDREIDNVLQTVSPHPLNLVQKISFGDRLKEVVHLMFGIPQELLWGDDKAKATLTQYTAEMFMNLVGKGKFPFKDKKPSDPMSVREILQFFGTEVGRRIYDKLWVDRTVETIHSIINDWRPILILVDDVRFEAELESIQKMNGVVIGLTRAPKSSAGSEHGSEKGHELLDRCNFVIDNQNMNIQEQCSALFPIFVEIMKN